MEYECYRGGEPLSQRGGVAYIECAAPHEYPATKGSIVVIKVNVTGNKCNNTTRKTAIANMDINGAPCMWCVINVHITNGLSGVWCVTAKFLLDTPPPQTYQWRTGVQCAITSFN